MCKCVCVHGHAWHMHVPGHKIDCILQQRLWEPTYNKILSLSLFLTIQLKCVCVCVCVCVQVCVCLCKCVCVCMGMHGICMCLITN